MKILFRDFLAMTLISKVTVKVDHWMMPYTRTREEVARECYELADKYLPAFLKERDKS